ncbi:ABC transporter permease [Cellulomonas uda]|uniref:Transport permease protein n=1 Tax=Cellulomonas uda TaxID=1714 RepID=A0A4Y3KI26_CELUD|nr:ABC transporter permease [Cellulomonas uda]NII66384.1 lipooligosaccharide transport system permease protein [Cellulomonas uda]GEA82648.1 transport permease protein [Cellulomonas uda]
MSPSTSETTSRGPGADEMVDAARAGASRPRRFGAWYIAEHQLKQMRSYGWTVVMTGIGSPLLYLLGIGLGLAAFLDVPVASGPDGPIDYLWFVAPALLATAAVSVTTEEFTYTVMGGFRWRRVFWGMNASPVSPQQICTGLVIAVTLRMVFVSAAYYLLIVAFGAVGDPLAGALMVPVGVLAGLAFGLPLLAFSASLKEDKGQFAMVQRFVFTPLFLFSGTFYPLDTLPVGLQWVGWVSPIWHASELGRLASYGPGPGAWPWAAHVAVLLVLATVGWFVARRVFTGRLRG